MTVDGLRLPVRPGQTIAAVLTAAGWRAFRATRLGGRPRGLFCGMGVCHDCLVTVNGQPGVRACLEPAADGDLVRTDRPANQPGSAPRWPNGERAERGAGQGGARGGSEGASQPGASGERTGRGVGQEYVVVVGAGPAGLAAAVAAAGRGARVLVLDAGRRPGGQYLRQPEVPGTPGGHGSRGRGAGLLRRATELGVVFRLDHQVVSADLDGGRPVLHALAGDRLVEVPAAALVLATGAYDRVLPFPGWDLPGVVTAGGAQALLTGQGVLPGRRVLVAGTGPFLIAVAAGLATAGAEVAAVVEANDPLRWRRELPAAARAPGRVAEAAGYLAVLARHRVPLWRRCAVTAVEPAGDALRARIDRVGAGWRVLRPGRTRTVEVDAVCVGHGFTPSVELAVALGCPTATDPRDGNLVVPVDRWQRTGVPRVFAAGEVTGVGGAGLAMTEGAIAGLAAAVEVGRLDPAGLRRAAAPLLARARRQGRFAGALHAVYPVRDGWLDWLGEDTVLCRCEEVTVGRARADIADLGADDLRALKLLSRVGMGRCQGRICGWPAARLLSAATGRDPDLRAAANRPLAQPVPLRLLAGPPPRG